MDENNYATRIRVLEVRNELLQAELSTINAELKQLRVDTNQRFNQLITSMWRIAGAIMTAMLLAATVVGIIVQ